MLLTYLACAERSPANVLLITLDTVRADALAAGHTPRLDALAAEGTVFEAAYTVTPLTIPAHASIFTGLTPQRHGVRDNGDARLPASADTLAERLHGAGYQTMASVGAEVTTRHWGFSQGFDAYFDELGIGRRWTAERRADAVVRDALAWLRTHSDAPWFAWVHLYDAHDPYRPPEPFATDYAADPYIGEIAFVDAQVGVLLDGLGADAADTWVFVVADHGESRGEHGEAHHGVLLYDGATRVPFIVRAPGGGAARTQTSPVSLVDLMPTVLGALGAEVPPGLDGVDLSPMLRGDTGDVARDVHLESLYAWRHFGWAPQRAIVTPTHTLIDSTTPELYAATDRAQAFPLDDATTIGSLRAAITAWEAGLSQPLAGEQATTEQIARLEALGYLTGASGAGRAPDGSPAQGLPDPVSRLPVLESIEAVRAAYRAGDMPRARALAEASVAADPGLEESRLLLATVQWRTGDLPAAIVTATALDAERPSSQSRHLLGLLALAQGRTAEGAAHLADTVARDPRARAATETWLQTLLVLEDLPTLARASEQAHADLPESAIVTGMYGVSLALAGNATAARPMLETAIAAQPDQPFVHHALGLALRDLGDTSGALAAFNEEIRRYPPGTPSRRALEEMSRRP